MPLLWLLSLQVAAAWSPPARAIWMGEKPPVEVRLHAHAISMRSTAPIDVDLVAQEGAFFAVSPFLEPTRGIAFEVLSESGQLLPPAESMPLSTPPPVVKNEQLVAVSRSSPYRIATRERAATIFPGPGTYKLRARIYLFSSDLDRVRSAQLTSDTITIEVTS